MKTGWFRALAVAGALVVAFPPASEAQTPPPSGSVTLNFVPPKGWTDESRPNGRPGYWKDWGIRDGANVHSLVLSVTREKLAAAPYRAAAVEYFKTSPNRTILDSGPATTCGDVAAYRYSYRSNVLPDHPMIIVHVLVDMGTLLGDVSYSHAPGVADRADALDAMSTLCDAQIYAMRPPDGWRRGAIMHTDKPGVDGFTAPEGHGALIALAVSSPVTNRELAATVMKPPSTVLSDAEEQCGSLRVRHAVSRSPKAKGDAAEILETVAGYRHGASYFYSHVHPEAEPADPQAQRALTSFCDAAATLATPVPVAPGAPPS
jgi:hypothetical protein